MINNIIRFLQDINCNHKEKNKSTFIKCHGIRGGYRFLYCNKCGCTRMDK